MLQVNCLFLVDGIFEAWYCVLLVESIYNVKLMSIVLLNKYVLVEPLYKA